MEQTPLMLTTSHWTPAPGGWYRRTKGGHFRIMTRPGLTFGPFWTEDEAKHDLATKSTFAILAR